MSTADSIKEKRSRLSPAKQALLEQRLRGASQDRASGIPRRPQPDRAPLSFSQQRLWFLDQLETGKPFYNVSRQIRIRGSLNISALQAALNTLCERHEALRTTFEEIDNQPVQIIHSGQKIDLPISDLSDQPEERRRVEVTRLTTEFSELGFDLAKGPLIRATLIRLSPDKHVLALSLHHIITDAWSTALLVRELVALYEADVANKPSPLPELPIQYADYAVWQRTYLQSEVLEKQLGYWKDQLAEAPKLLQLPTDRPRPPVQTFHGACESISLPTSLSSELKDLSQKEGVTLFMTLLAAFQTLLWRHSLQEEIVVGVPIANRTRRETESLVGFFVNTLVMRTRVADDPTFPKLLQRVKEITLGAYANQDLPFEKLVEELQPERSLSHNPLFQVTLALQNVPQEFTLGNFTVDIVGIEARTTRLDLEAYVWDLPAGLSVSFVYSTDLFDQQTIRSLLHRFQRLLEGLRTNMDQHVSALQLLPADERTQLLVDWNACNPEAASECVHSVFEEQVRRSPQQVAVCFEQEQLTYEELNARANQLAHYLIARGVGPEKLVGVCLERSFNLVVALLGILKAGAAYVPLDPAYPSERLAFVCQDAGLSLLLTEKSLEAIVRGVETEIIWFDTLTVQIVMKERDDPKIAVNCENSAYVIYTSGSTGTPKGVVVTHRNIVRLMQTTTPQFHFGPDDVWTLFHSYAFDFSVWEIWGALCFGGKLVVVPYLTSRSPEEFYELLGRQGVTILNQTPSAFRQLIQAEKTADINQQLALREVIFGGEALEFQSLRPWIERHGDIAPRLVNMYGITETTVHVTYRPLNADDIEESTGSIIGKPLTDLQVYILDRQQQLTPIGVAGEMYVGGGGLARGYLNRPELTAERFVPHPFSSVPGARLYRTGDLARFRNDGDIEYLGRIDRQVKIRGFRIELGEIEALLAQHSMIRECVVLAREDGEDRQLLAFFVPESNESPASEALRAYLKERLPPYMVPTYFVGLDRFPLTPNGKIDERKLPVPDRSRAASAQTFVAPRTEMEESVAALWRELLGREEISIHDNFFDLGGHSLLATQVMARIREAFKVNLPLRSFFEKPTVAGITDVLLNAKHEDQEVIPAIKRLPRA